MQSANLPAPRMLACLALAWTTLVAFESSRSFGAEALRVTPAELKLTGNFAQCQLVAARSDSAQAVNERSEDLTATASYTSSDPGVVTVSERGRLLAVGNGQTTVHVKVGDVTQQVSVTVEGVAAKPTIDYRLQVSPILSKAGCNKGACHASQHGKGGFGLSVVGSDPDKDYASLVRDRVQRRVDLLTPEQSLALLKPTMQTPHGGGRRLERGSVAYDLLVAWLAGGRRAPRAMRQR